MLKRVRRQCTAVAFILTAALVCGAENPPPVTAPVASGTTSTAADETAKKAFDADYDAGIAAVADKNWTLARSKLTAALKELGDRNDSKKSTAQVLLGKAERLLVKDDALYTASELLRLKQWVEAEEAFRKVIEVSGETDTLHKDILACREGLENENPSLRAANDLLKAKKWKEATDAYNKVSDTLGGIRAIREGLTAAQLGMESDSLLIKGPEQLRAKKWDDAFNTYKRLNQILGDTEEIRKGISAAQAGYAEEHKVKEGPAQP